MPIDGVSNIRRMPRLGRIRLGIKVEGEKSFPQPTDYFVVPEEIKQYVGDSPKSLKIMFPTEKPEEFAPQWLKCYSQTQLLICSGDGIVCRRKVDTDNGDFASHTTQNWEWKNEMPCDPATCPKAVGVRPQCQRVMSLFFFLPDVPGLGCWQLDTRSIYSIININSAIDLIRGLCGRISQIPLTLSLEPREVTPPGMSKKTVHILEVHSEIKLAELQRFGAIKPERVLLPEAEEEGPPDDLLLEGAAAGTPPALPQATPLAPAPAKPAAPPPVAKSRDPQTVNKEDVPDLEAVERLAFECWGEEPPTAWKKLGYIRREDVNIKPWDCFLQLRALNEERGPEDGA